MQGIRISLVAVRTLRGIPSNPSAHAADTATATFKDLIVLAFDDKTKQGDDTAATIMFITNRRASWRSRGRCTKRSALWLSFSLASVLGTRAAHSAKPPVQGSSAALSKAWARATSDFERCSAQATAGARAGTVWIDVLFPANRNDPTWKLRASPGLSAADRACAQKVMASRVLPMLAGTYGVVDEPISTMELPLGKLARYLPPLRSFVTTWLALSHAPSSSALREQLRRGVGPLAAVARDSCLQVRREERLQTARVDWLADAGRQVSQVWRTLAERLGNKHKVAEPVAFLADRLLLVSGARLDTSVRYKVPGSTPEATAPGCWSRRYETYCLQEVDAALGAEIDRGVTDVATCIADDGLERLVAPRLASPPGKKLHALAVADTRTCALDERDAIVCCGLRDGAAPQGAFTALALDDRYACAIRSSGELACWGKPALGATPPSGRFSRVSVAGSGACAITRSARDRVLGRSFELGAAPGRRFRGRGPLPVGRPRGGQRRNGRELGRSPGSAPRECRACRGELLPGVRHHARGGRRMRGRERANGRLSRAR